LPGHDLTTDVTGTNVFSRQILAVNAGSSSLKVRLYRLEPGFEIELIAQVERIGSAQCQVHVQSASGATLHSQDSQIADHGAAMRAIVQNFLQFGSLQGVIGSGHRIVHGGRQHVRPELVDDALLRSLAELSALAPAHNPAALAVLEATEDVLPGIPRVACFDTAFHATMPLHARQFALPRRLYDEGVVRYGFHGLSCESVVAQLRGTGVSVEAERLIIAHLGHGSSMTAVLHGESIDTTMAFTPLSGLMMSTRSGDLDPGLLIYLMREDGMSADALDALLSFHSGLLGVSETSGDMRDLLAREQDDPRAAEAITLYCYQARKFLGALIAALGGVNRLVFTGGIGENAAVVRERICLGLEDLGIQIDPARNQQDATVISDDSSPVLVQVIATDEERIIAKHTYTLLQGGDPNALYL